MISNTDPFLPIPEEGDALKHETHNHTHRDVRESEWEAEYVKMYQAK